MAATLAERVRQRHGLSPALTLTRIGDHVRTSGPSAVAALLGAGRDDSAWAGFVDRLLVHETYFYRHPAQLDALAARLRRRSGPGAARIWCAGCATGEEAWTVALIAADAGIPVSVLGTDLSTASLAAARAGHYQTNGGLDPFRAVPERARRHFGAVLGPDPAPAWTVPDRLRSNVRFLRHDVLNPPPLDGADVVLCRNMLIYLDTASAAAAEQRLAQALRPGGLLLTGPAETPRDPALFVADGDPGAMIWRRTAGA
jgi:chemotaxis protein methyltransferase CheR